MSVRYEIISKIRRRPQNAEGDNMNIIDALKRLERAGDENSRVTEKLKAATVILAEKIQENIETWDKLPKGYQLLPGSGEYNRYLIKNLSEKDGKVTYFNETQCEDPYFIDYHKDTFLWISRSGKLTRKGALEFAKDISEGLLDEISAHIKEAAKKAEKAAEVLEAASENM